jgi:parvulin-like peptidyl-prolyl isomerase
VDYQRALAAFASDRRDGRLDADLRKSVLDRLIDEELLVQRGLELRLATRDPMVRRNLSAAVIALLVARAEDDAANPDDDALRAFYRENQDLFSSPDLVRVEQAFFGNKKSGGAGAAAERAKAAHQRLEQGESFAAVAADADETTYSLPDTLLPLDKLREYVGPTATREVALLRPGEITAPLAGVSGHRILRVVDRRPGRIRPFDEVRELVRAEFRRNAGDTRVHEVLEQRREAAEIRVAEDKL